MNPYFFHLEIEPYGEENKAEEIQGAYAIAWVFGKTLSHAREKAIRYVNDCNWTIKSIEHTLELTPELISELGEVELGDYQQAELLGISARFYTWSNKNNLQKLSGEKMERVAHKQ